MRFFFLCIQQTYAVLFAQWQIKILDICASNKKLFNNLTHSYRSYPAASHEASLGTVCAPDVRALTPEVKSNLEP